MPRIIQVILVSALLCGLSGCFTGVGYGPDYGYPAYGYAPYSYGWPVYAMGYAPVFAVHHPWEEHHAFGHERSFFHPEPRVAHIMRPGFHGGGLPGGFHEGNHR